MDDGALAAVGSTPVMRLCRLVDDRHAAVWVKLVGANPTGSGLHSPWTDRSVPEPDMIDGYRKLGEEILEQVPGPIDALCLYVGTAGCFLGVSRALRGRYPAMHRVVVEPAESAVLSGGSAGTHRIEGGGVVFLVTIQVDSGLKYLAGDVFVAAP